MSNRYFKLLLVIMLAAMVLGVSPAPFVRSQDGSTVTVSLTPYEGNPIVEKGSAQAWDALNVWTPVVVFHDGLYHMFFKSTQNWSTLEIGYATSTDGLTWEKYAGNPVFQADGTGFDKGAVGVGAVLVEGDTWVLYYTGETALGIGGPIGRATAPAPTGPWTRSDDPVLAVGGPKQWDAYGMIPTSVIATEDGYVMYYIGAGLPETTELKDSIGRATSPDGVTWTKYDDPSTTEPPYTESDPVLTVGLDGWDMVNVRFGTVQQTANGWEMFYSEKGSSDDHKLVTYRIGYATSPDGIHWTKSADFPILSAEDDPAAPFGGNVVVGSFFVNNDTYFVYYDYHLNGEGIGVATGTVTRE